MDRIVITPRIRLGKSVKHSVSNSVYWSVYAVESSIWESVSSPVDISMRSSVYCSVDDSVLEPIYNSIIWRIEL